MRKDKGQISVVAQQLERRTSYFRWGNALAGLAATLLVFCALSILAIGLSASSVTENMVRPHPFLDFSPAHRWLLFWIFASGGVALFVGPFLATRSSASFSRRAAIMEGLVIAALFFPLSIGLSFLASDRSAHYRSVADSIDLRAANPAIQDEIEPVIGRALKGLTFNRPEERITEVLMKKIASNRMDSAYRFLSKNAGISLAQSRRRLDPIRAEVQAGFSHAGPRAANIARFTSLMAFVAIALGSAAAMTGGFLGVRMNLRARVNMRDRELIEETAAA